MHGSRLFNAIIGLVALATVAAYFIYNRAPIAAGANGRVYARSPQSVQAELQHLPTPMVFTGPRLRLKGQTTDRTEWALQEDGGLPIAIIATHTPEKDGKATRVQVVVNAPEVPAGGPNPLQKVTIVKLFQATIMEQIDATLTGRAFSSKNVSPEMATAMAMNIRVISRQMDRAAEASAEQSRRNIEKAYEAEARGETPTRRW